MVPGIKPYRTALLITALPRWQDGGTLTPGAETCSSADEGTCGGPSVFPGHGWAEGGCLARKRCGRPVTSAGGPSTLASLGGPSRSDIAEQRRKGQDHAPGPGGVDR